ncbi:MAG: Gfo/Idh/MocA family oxidoreductase [Bacteroidota bacterium]|nr:Gfo/Idh/MocA family oxidoreductase [Bacteroidota bacterium]MDP4232702.1 Gfo/Idh/MocA family oxidoreductase [Bacteroidota bacterium]MDP4243165.1 Gfo/Idh/MocA family oxidoreductase [Bacteroidota bacterium]MDP4287622.1 Gfo/Idh/MocA family oxidoreductase [Bacteroidota bacterium]
MVRIGIIGAGYWGSNLVRAFNDTESAVVAAVADKKQGRLSFVSKRYPHIRTTDDMESILADPEIDAVVVATPVPTHYDVGRRVLESGKHAMIEKPMAYSYDDARKLRDLADSLGKVLTVGHVYQFSPAVEWLATRISSGNLGRLFHIDSIRINLGPPASEVDVVWDLAPHDLSILIYLMWQTGLPTDVRSMRVMAGSFVKEKLADLTHIFIEFECGMTAHVHVSWVTSNKVRLMQISAEHGTVVFDDMQPAEKVKIYSAAVDTRIGADESGSAELTYRPGDIFIPTLPRHEPLAAECRHFVDCIESGKKPINGGAIGVEVVRLLEMIMKEARRDN